MNLTSYLEKHGISRSEFARKVETSPPYITMLCAGSFWPGRDMMIRIIKATDGKVTPNDLLGIDIKTLKGKTSNG